MLPIEVPTMTPPPFRSSPGGAWADLYLIAEPSAVTQARRFTVTQLHRWRLMPLSETVTLVTSELVTNAVRVTCSPSVCLIESGGHEQPAVVAVRLRRTPASLFVEVWDRNPRPPVLTHGGTFDEGGRGLPLVAAFTKAWDHYRCEGRGTGKVVWAEIAIGPVPS